MAIEKTLKVEKRLQHGKGPNGRLRGKDLIPGVFYTPAGENVSVQIPALPLEKTFGEMGYTSVFNLEISDGDATSVHPVLFWKIQRHPYKKVFTHIDFYGVDLDKVVKVEVPVEFVGTPKGVKLGGVMETYRETVRLASKPLDMPRKLVVDVSALEVNNHITASDLNLPPNVKTVCSGDTVIVSVLTKSKEELEGEAAEAAAAAAPAAS
ncbi:MAG: 50S ribosomal protein L25/general stress protein Ctc [Desulfovibrio sp.]|jgi:large subunit ribosomal protein L25|nr:50S ribosomal protein L25/general stress protein Ctc [Desulfovibrio sp.]